VGKSDLKPIALFYPILTLAATILTVKSIDSGVNQRGVIACAFASF
jgi:hypothetical protein